MVVPGIHSCIEKPGLQNTSMYSALRASARLFKFGPTEFSTLRFIQATKLNKMTIY